MLTMFLPKPGFRNHSIAMWTLVLMAWLGWCAGGSVTEMAGTYAAIGVSMATIIGARGINKWAENGKPKE